MKKSIKILLPFLFTVLAIQAYAQTGPVLSPILSPRIEWKSITWAPYKNDGVTEQTQDGSGDDWLMDVIDYYENGVHVGYAACGYSTWGDFELYDEYAPCADYDVIDQINTADFWTEGQPRGIPRQTIGIYDLKGNLLDLYRYSIGEFYKIYQADNGDLIATGRAFSPVPFNDMNGLMYVNPELGETPVTYANFPVGFCGAQSEATRKMEFNVIRINPNGNIAYNNFYNNGTTFEESFFSIGVGAGIAPADGDNIYVVGRIGDHPSIVKLDEQGNMMWKINRPVVAGGEGQYFWIDKYQDKYVLSGWYMDPLENIAQQTAFLEFIDLNGFDPNEDHLAFETPAWDERTTEANGYANYGFDFPPENPTWEDAKQHASKSVSFTQSGDIVWPVMANNRNLYFNGLNVCEGKIFVFNQSGTLITPNSQPIELGELRAYDMYFSSTATDDGGFAIVSTRHSPQYFGTSNLPSNSDPDIGPCLEAVNDDVPEEDEIEWSTIVDYFDYWSTCSYIAKFDENFEFEWDKIWDSTDNAPRECPPGNLKQQECVYRIIQAPDGGLVICGNTSDNIDDYYMVKLFSDCGIRDFIAVIDSEGENTDEDNYIVDLDDGIVEIGENTVWDTDKKVLGKVRVLDGVKLSIEGATIDFAGHSAESGGIEIEQNALLEINDSYLTHLEPSGEECPATWTGINVWGTTDQPQNPVGGYYHQGRLIVDNSTIEHAYNAITNWKWQDWDANGGIIQVTNTSFINTRRAVEFMEYQNYASDGTTLTSDLSYFNECQFILNNDYQPGPERTHPLITLWRVHGVKFRGCEFINDMTNVENSQQLTAGIASNSAHYFVTSFCPDPPAVWGTPCSVPITPSSFTGFHHGVLVTQGNSGAKHVHVANSIFNDNMTGIELRATDFSKIHHNEFYVGEHLFEPDFIDNNERNVGVYTFETSAYSIEENHFEKVGSNGWPTHGAVIQASGAAENELYKNDLEGLTYGSVSVDDNREPGGLSPLGLQFLCNTNTGNGRDFDVINEGGIEFPGVRYSHGNTPNEAAGNVFSQNSAYSLDFMHFAQEEEMDQVAHVAYDSDQLQNPDNSETTSNVAQYQVTADPKCASRFGSGKTKYELKLKFDQASDEYYDLLYNYHQLVDGGDTEGMLDEISGTWPQEAWDLRNSLLADSPFLSVQVLIAAADRDVMPHAMLMEVLLANPDALRSSQLIDHVQYYMPNPLPQYMIDILIDARSQVTVLTNLVGAMGARSAEMAVNHKMVIQEMLSDTLGLNADSLLTFMARLENIPNHYALAMTHLEMGDPTDGKAVLTNMSVIWDRMSTEQETEWEQFNDLYDLFDAVQTDGRNEARLTDSEIEDLLTIAHTPHSGRAGGRAWNTLCFHYGICPEGQLPPAPRNYEAYEASNTLSDVAYNPVEAYPNPANSYTTLRYELFQSHPQSYIRIFDTNGRQTQSFTLGDNYEGQVLWDTRGAKPGMYFFQLWQNDEKVHSGKIVVQH